MANYDIKDLSLSAEGKLRINWASREMPVLKSIEERFAKEKPFKDLRISTCLHVTTETANLVITLKEGGAAIVLCAANPLSTQDDVAAALVEYGIATYARKGEDNQTYYKHILSAIEHKPNLTMDDGADLVTILHKERPELIVNVIGGTEETTTGVIRLKNMEREGKLKYPIIAVNEARTKRFFDNRYGTGQSTVDGITRATNVLWSGKKVVVCGYGWCGKGVARRAQGLGARVIVTEVDPVAALEAVMDGYQAMQLIEAVKLGDIFITATGNTNVIDEHHLKEMKDGAILANTGHFNVEINIPALERLTKVKKQVRPFVEDYVLRDGRHLYLLAEGRVVNLAVAEGHPASVMDMSFSNQALSVEYLTKRQGKLELKVHSVPDKIDTEVGRLKLQAMGIAIDSLTEEQKKYLGSWEAGT